MTPTQEIPLYNPPPPRHTNTLHTHTLVLYTDNDTDLIFNALMDYWLETVNLTVNMNKHHCANPPPQ